MCFRAIWNIYLATRFISYHLSQPGDSSVSSNESPDKDNEDDDDEDDDDDDEVEVDVPDNEVRELVAEANEFFGKTDFRVPSEIAKFLAAERTTSWQVSNQVKIYVDADA